MSTTIAQLAPAEVWTQFERLNEIPRGSKKEQQVIEFMRKFGKGLQLETIVDKSGNVIIRKPATSGMENRKGVVLQAHLDMVHQKNTGTDFDFDSQGIESYVDNGWVKARGTTLGADNGVGVASIMAVLASDEVEHGPLEGLFTIDEETGMTGAFGLAPDVLQGRILLNTDTEDEGELCIGCAGGIETDVALTYSEVPVTNGSAFRLTVKGLRGGHSGCDIHLGRGNANKLMNRLLWKGGESFGLKVHSIDGGSLSNAIPRESFAEVVVDSGRQSEFQAHFSDLAKTLQNELRIAEPNLTISCQEGELPDRVMDPSIQEKLTNAIYAAPNGVIRMSDSVPGLVESSTSMARVQLESGRATVKYLTRSSVESAKHHVAQMIEATFRLLDADVKHSGGYPGWEPNADSEILRVMKQLYRELFGAEPKVNAVHAGLECGIIGSHYPEMDMISFGPTIENPHSPDEMCEIASVEKYWQYLLAVLKNIPPT